MRVAISAETFTPAVNGVVNSVLHVADCLANRGHEVTVIAPSGAPYRSASGHRIDVRTVPARMLPGYRGLAIARPTVDLRDVLADIAPDIVHLASPIVLGWSAVRAAGELGLPSVAVFQTDLTAFARRYGLGLSAPVLWSRLRHIHNCADLTLAPSSSTAYLLRRQGIGPVAMWSRGVDRDLFHPQRRDEQWRQTLAGDRLLVGFVGRLAPEKRVELLRPVSQLPGVQLVVVGEGPRRRSLERVLREAHFTGLLTGPELGRTVASLDLLVHPGADETFCQVVQEALCSGVPVIAAASGGPIDLVRHGDNGWLWAGDEPDVLAAQVAEVRDNPTERAAVAARARPSVAGRTWARVTDQLVAHYLRVIEAAASRDVPGRRSVAGPGRS